MEEPQVFYNKDQKYAVIDNAVPADVFENFQAFFMSGEPEWTIGTKTANPELYVETIYKGTQLCKPDIELNNIQGNVVLLADSLQTIYFGNSDDRFIARTHLYQPLMCALVRYLNPISLIRIKINVTFNTSKIVELGYHQDRVSETGEFDHMMNACFYVNTCDGYTRFLDKDGKRGDKVDSVANRLVYFPNTVRHAGTTTTNEKARYVVNINYIPRYKCPFHEFLGKEFMLN